MAAPQIDVQLGVGEINFETNDASFTTDEEVQPLWCTLVSSNRLRPGWLRKHHKAAASALSAATRACHAIHPNRPYAL